MPQRLGGQRQRWVGAIRPASAAVALTDGRGLPQVVIISEGHLHGQRTREITSAACAVHRLVFSEFVPSNSSGEHSGAKAVSRPRYRFARRIMHASVGMVPAGLRPLELTICSRLALINVEALLRWRVLEGRAATMHEAR